jgi:hypothetical protein
VNSQVVRCGLSSNRGLLWWKKFTQPKFDWGDMLFKDFWVRLGVALCNGRGVGWGRLSLVRHWQKASAEARLFFEGGLERLRGCAECRKSGTWQSDMW